MCPREDRGEREASVAEAKGSNSTKTGAAAGEGAPGAGGAGVQLKNLWPIPGLVLGGALLVGGLAVAMMGRPKAPADIPPDLLSSFGVAMGLALRRNRDWV